MPVNPKYAQLAKGNRTEQGEDEKNLPIFDWKTVGSELKGTITYVGDFWEQENKFYRPEKRLFDENGKEEVIKQQGQPTITKQKVIFLQPGGEKIAVYFSKNGHWDAIEKGLSNAGLEDMAPGQKFIGKRLDDQDKAHKFEFRFQG